MNRTTPEDLICYKILDFELMPEWRYLGES